MRPGRHKHVRRVAQCATPDNGCAHWTFPEAAVAWEVNRVIADFVAAQRCQDAGLDGIERSMTGHVVDRFLSPLTNLGEDNLDGSVENRLAFPVRLARTVRYAVGPDYHRSSANEHGRQQRWRTRGRANEAARRLAAAGGRDFCSVLKYAIDTNHALAQMIPSLGQPSAPFLGFAARSAARSGVQIGVPSAAVDPAEGLSHTVEIKHVARCQPAVVKMGSPRAFASTVIPRPGPVGADPRPLFERGM